MEFLGDSVLQFVVSVYLFKHFPEHHEGHLTVGYANVITYAKLKGDVAILSVTLKSQDIFIFSENPKLKPWLNGA